MPGLEQRGCARVAPLVHLVEAEGAFQLFLELRRMLEDDGYPVVTFSSGPLSFTMKVPSADAPLQGRASIVLVGTGHVIPR